jgi:DnaJ like chaperone protein
MNTARQALGLFADSIQAVAMKPLLVLFGAFLAYQVFRSFVAGYRAFQKEGAGKRRINDGFAQALFQSMGYLAKVDGRVTENEIRAARTVMHRLGLGPAAVRNAINWFNEGKEPNFSLVQSMRKLRRVDARAVEERRMFVRLVLEVSLAKSRLHQRERAAIWKICTELEVGRVELAQLEAMIRAQKGFRRSPAGDVDAARVKSAYEALGIKQDATNDEIKTSYRRLMNRNHPDKLASSNPDAEVLAEAERRTREVRVADELLKARRAIR